MFLKVVGYEKFDFEGSDGKKIKGLRLHGVREDMQENESLIGDAVQSLWLSEDVYLNLEKMHGLEIGSTYYVGFKQGRKSPDIVLPASYINQSVGD